MSEKKPSLEVTEIPADKISAEVSSLLNRGARMLYASGVDMGVPGIRIDYYFTFDAEIPGRNLALRTFVNRKKPVIESVTPITTQADWGQAYFIKALPSQS